MTKHDNVSQGKIMKATEFVKKFGWVKTKSVLSEALKYRLTDKFTYNTLEEQWDLYVDDLKRLVESHELVESYGGLSNSRKWIERTVFKLSDSMIALKKAIADVEACQ